MKTAVRRRLAVLVTSTLAVSGVGIALAPSAFAGNITSVTPQFVFNNDDSEEIVFRHQTTVPSGSVAAFEYAATPTAAILSALPGTVNTPNPLGDDTSTATFNFSDNGNNSGTDANPPLTSRRDGPADAGVYNGRLQDRPTYQAGQPPQQVDTCQSCFTVLPSAQLRVTSLSPSGVSANSTQNTVIINGDGFERAIGVEVLLNGVRDPNIEADAVPISAGDPVNDGVTRKTQLQRRFILGNTPPGIRDVRVRTLDGRTAVCSGCFTVNGAALTSVIPTAGSNDPDQQPQLRRLTFSGPAGGVTNGTPVLRLESDPGSSTRQAETITGTNVTFTSTANSSSVSADFDLRSRVPGTYRPVVVRSDFSENRCTCTFNIAQVTTPTITTVDRDPSTPAVEKDLRQGSTQTFQVNGTNFSRGTRVVVDGTGVTTTAVEFVSPTLLRATFQAAPGAPTGDRNVTAVLANGQSGPPCTSCLLITAGPTSSASSSASASASSSPSASATRSASPTASASATSTSTVSPSATTGTQGGRYVGLASPVRVLDSRNGTGTSPGRKLGEVVLDLSNQISGSATAAVLNVTVTNPTGPGFVVVYPNGNSKPGTSNVNYVANQTQANEVLVGLPASKKVSIFVDTSSAHVIADLVGYFTTANVNDAGRVTAQTPQRVLDSRNGTGTTQGPKTGEVVLDLTGKVPAGTTSVVLNVTVTGPNARGFVVAYPTGTNRPGTSNVNFEQNQTQANEVVTRVGTGSNANRVSLFVDSASAAVIADLVATIGSNAAASRSVVPLSQPQRVLDTREGLGTTSGRKNGEVILTLPTSAVPAGATGVVLNVTTTGSSGPGFVAVYPAGTANPGTSNVNFRPGINQANEVLTGVNGSRQVTLFVGGRDTPVTHLVADVVGYLTS